MNHRTLFFFSAALAMGTGTAMAQPGSLDMTFNPGDVGFGYGDGANGYVHTVGSQEDGKILIAGNFTAYNGTERNRIARLNADGSLDTSFDPGSGANGSLFALALQPDGQILIGGEFTTYAGTARNRIARLNTDGSLDTSFDPGSGVEYVDYDYQTRINTIVWHPDGKILIGGTFTTYNGIARNRIAQLDTDGSLDTAFDPGAGPDGNGISTAINTIAVQPDDKILVAGYFTVYHGTAHNRIARLNADGSLDTTFDPGTGAEYNGASLSIEAMVLQPDNRILIGGGFITYNGTARNHIARLNADGSLDTSFDPGTGADSSPGDVLAIALQPDGKILIAGRFTSYNGTAQNRIARLDPDGSVDTSFNPGSGANSGVGAMALGSDGKILIGGGYFTSYDGTDISHIARLHADGSLDPGFSPGGTGSNDAVRAIAQQPDGRILLAGSFGVYDGTARNRVARLNADGGLDMSFDPGTWMSGGINSLAIQPDGRLLIGGSFDDEQGSPPNNIARLNTDGSLDSTWIGSVFGNVCSVVQQPDGKILVGGGAIGAFLSRLNTDGSFDTAFGTGSLLSGLDLSVYAVALQPDGKILVGGHFHQGDTIPFVYPHCFARLNTDGSVDTNFTFIGTPGPLTGEGWVRSIAVQADGAILIGGDFTNYNTVPRNRIARLGADGSLDTSFDPGDGADGTVTAIVAQPDGKILIGGAFTSYNGTDRNHIARLNPDGSLDMTFDPGSGANGTVATIALQPDGRILIGGEFTGYDGIGRNRIARLMGDDGSVAIADDQGTGSISVYPNPGNELFTVAVAAGAYRYEVLDALGRKLLDRGTQLTPFTLDLSFLAAGTYMLRWHGDGRQGSVPLIKQ